MVNQAARSPANQHDQDLNPEPRICPSQHVVVQRPQAAGTRVLGQDPPEGVGSEPSARSESKWLSGLSRSPALQSRRKVNGREQRGDPER